VDDVGDVGDRDRRRTVDERPVAQLAIVVSPPGEGNAGGDGGGGGRAERGPGKQGEDGDGQSKAFHGEGSFIGTCGPRPTGCRGTALTLPPDSLPGLYMVPLASIMAEEARSMSERIT